jgi:hypothetical protein
MQSVETDFSDLQDWLLPRQKELGLAPEERITKHEIASQEYFALRYNDCAEFIIEGNAGRLIFGIRGAENFYKKYYTQAMLEQELSQKYAFSFSAPEFKNSISEFALLSNIYAPEKYDAFRKAADDALIEERENSFAVQCGKTAVEIAKTTLNGNLFNKLKNPGSFMVIGKDSSRIYIPGILAIPEQTLEKPVRVQLLVEETDEQIMPYLEAIKDAVFQMPFTPENAAVIKKCSTLARKIWYIDYAKLKLSGAADVNDRVDTLLVLHGTFEPETEWRAFAKTEATAIYQNAVNAITRENCAETVILLEKLRGITGISRKQTVKDIAEIFFRAGNDTAGVFNALFDAKFSG